MPPEPSPSRSSTLRTLPERLKGEESQPFSIRVDELVSTTDRPGFGILMEDPPHEACVGAIGRVWERDIPFIHRTNAGAFEDFDDPGYVKVAWALRVSLRGADHCHGT